MTTARETALKLSIAIKDLTDYEDYGKEIFPMILAALEQRDRVIEVLRKALEFYSNERSWYLVKDPVTKSEIRRSIEYDDTESSGKLMDNGDNILYVVGGKHAREALTAVEKILETL